MTKQQAEAYFAFATTEPCSEPNCNAGVGELCDTETSWLHASRLRAHHDELIQKAIAAREEGSG